VSPVRYTEDGPLAVAHRGGAGLRPENTLAAFSHAVSLGVLWLESDVRASADGVAVLHHDRTLARLFGLDAAVADLTWDQLRSLRTAEGDRLVRPADVLGCFPLARWPSTSRSRLPCPACSPTSAAPVLPPGCAWPARPTRCWPRPRPRSRG
jgi:glycerophosphoryl diester phosphodiesterase